MRHSLRLTEHLKPPARPTGILTVICALLAGCSGHSPSTQPQGGMSPGFESSVNDLLTRYAACLDRPHAPCADLFVTDGTLNLAKGREAIAALLDKESAIGSLGRHHVVNVRLTPEGPDRAAVMSDIKFRQTDAAGKWVVCSTYRYLDEIVTENGVLKFSRRGTEPLQFRRNLGNEDAPNCESWGDVGEPGSFETAAANLIARYGETVDMREMGAMANLFTEDGSVSGFNDKNETIRIHGRKAIEIYMGEHAGTAIPGLHTQRFAELRQTGPNSGSSMTYMTFFRRDAAGIWQNRLAYRYFDTFRRVDGVWLISRRDVVPPSADEAAAEAGKVAGAPVAAPDTPPDNFDNEARALIAGYSRAVDTRDLPACKRLYAPNATSASIYAFETGRAEITCGLGPKVGDSVGSHVVANIWLKRETADRGSGITDAAYFRRDDAGKWVATSHPRYFDQFVRIDGHWLIDHRENTSVGR